MFCTRIVARTVVAFGLLAPAVGLADTDAAPDYEPTEAYEDREIEGWRIKLNRRLIADEPQLCAEVLRELESQLYLVTRVVPPPALAKIRRITIWVELYEKNHPCAVYHPDVKWLKEHEMNPAKHRCVELANARNFVGWTIGQPWMMLHELAHGYHHQFLENGYRNQEVQAAFDAAIDGTRYGKVSHIKGGERDHYAATNPMEYFAETSEAFFGVNDYYPYVRPELKQYDPVGLATVKKLWESAAQTDSKDPAKQKKADDVDS